MTPDEVAARTAARMEYLKQVLSPEEWAQVVGGVQPADRQQQHERALRCPYCGDEITAELTYTTMAHSEHRDLTGYECDNYRCDARWDNRGRVERPSKLRMQS